MLVAFFKKRNLYLEECFYDFKRFFCQGLERSKIVYMVLIFMRLPLSFGAFLGGSPRICFAFSLAHSLMSRFLFQKKRVFHLSFGFTTFKIVQKEQSSIKWFRFFFGKFQSEYFRFNFCMNAQIRANK